jgi:short-subunit dehydrogenase
MVRLNVMSVLHVFKYMAREMATRRSGRILITSSIAATMPTPYQAVYGATKASERSLSQSLREELKGSGVTVTALMPGATETNFFHHAGADDTKLGASEKDDPAEVAKEGFEALMAGKDHVVAGSLKDKFQAAAGMLCPIPGWPTSTLGWRNQDRHRRSNFQAYIFVFVRQTILFRGST